METQPKPNVLLELLKTIFFEVRNAFAPRTRTGHQGMESSYRKEKRLTHPDVFPKYFTLSVSPSDLPDQMIESLIYDLNSLEPAACSARFIPRAQDFQERKQLATLLRRLILFRERMTPRTTRSLIDNIYRNSNMFSKEGSRAFFNSEFDEALRLLLMLIDGLAPVEIDIVLRDIVQKTPSLELAVRVLDLTRRRTGQYFNIYESANVGELSRTLAERLNAEFVEKGRNIFSEEPSYAYVLHQWGKLSPDENRKINTYVFGLAERDPSILGKIIKTYTENWGEPLGIKLRRDDLADLYDEKRLYEMTKRSLDVSYSNDAEKTAVTEFIRQYEERQRTAAHEVKQQAARQSFITANSKGLQASGQRDFKTALEQYDLALQHIDWSDEHHWSDQVKLKRWETLLELALQKEGPIQREFFAEASRVASTEAQIRDLISAAYPGGTPDRAPCELHYCLFYYLLWNNPDASKRHEVKHNFETHYVIATGNSTSGRTDEIAQRCNELRERMEGGDKADKI